MTDDEHPVSLHRAHVELLRKVVETQRELIDVLEAVTDSDDDDADTSTVVYRDLAAEQASRDDRP